ncbi:DUF7522 family protein [Halomarina pelagica]|uniref:DUF7522 family protein n=1 Tax=Halomarina pelagica TaxID=2961599 RepID=UPI0020C3D299|nr:hypothetical protein [Halomarina sp. BND7]
MSTDISVDFAEGLVSTCRTGVGDTLRSVIYFTPDAFDLLYLRSDLYPNEERAREVKERFVEIEREGFDAQHSYTELSLEPDTEPEIGEYEFTIRVFSDGFISRVLVGDHGVLMTTDEMDIDAFEEIAVSAGKMLEEGASEARYR